MKLRDAWDQLRNKGRGYWLTVLVVIGLGTLFGDALGQSDRWVDVRYKVYEWQTRFIRPRPYPKRTVVVLVGDQEYWRGELAARAPIKRDYLARLLRALDSANPAVIAVDFDLRSPAPDGSLLEHPAYQAETQEFLRAVEDLYQRRPLVFPKTIGGRGKEGYVLESDIFDGLKLGGGGVRAGYIALPYDKRLIPLTLQLRTGGSIDSFAQAIARADNQKALQMLRPPDSLPFGTFMPPDRFDLLSAGQILNADRNARAKLACKIVILGGAWSRFAYGRGPQIDTYPSPAGLVGGVFLHANYVEAILDQRIYRPWSKGTVVALEVIFALLVAAAFALDMAFRWKLAGATLLCVSLILLSYFSLQNLGLFFDFFIPSLLVGFHAGSERVREWRRAYVSQKEVR